MYTIVHRYSVIDGSLETVGKLRVSETNSMDNITMLLCMVRVEVRMILGLSVAIIPPFAIEEF